MAEIDIKDLGDAAAIANTDKIMAIINGLGRNLNWAKLKEQLARELPVVTENSNGLMSSSLLNNSLKNSSLKIYDCNNISESGFYTIYPGSTNSPYPGEYVWLIAVFPGPDGIQIAYSFSNLSESRRKKVNGVWAQWKTI